MERRSEHARQGALAFSVNGDAMSGSLRALPSNRLVRVVTAKRTVAKKGT
jgi:hypothetical protein